jgi:hypothetical protein
MAQSRRGDKPKRLSQSSLAGGRALDHYAGFAGLVPLGEHQEIIALDRRCPHDAALRAVQIRSSNNITRSIHWKIMTTLKRQGRCHD